MFNSTLPFLMAKAHASHASAPTLSQITGMLNAQSVVEAENILQATGYSGIIDQVRPSVNLAEFEVAMRRKYAELITLFESSASSEIAILLHAYTSKIEAENLSMILQAIIRGNVSDELLHNIIPVGKFGLAHYKRMMEIPKVDVATDFIIEPELRHAVQNAIRLSDDPDEMVFNISSALSHASFEILQKAAPNWIKKEIEFLNIETVARATILGIDPTQWMVPNGVVYRNKNALASLKTPREVLNFILPQFPVPKPLELALQEEDGEIISKMEDYALNYLFHHHVLNFNIRGNRKEAILDFFEIKRAEIEDISRILLSKIKGIPQSVIADMIMMPIYKK